MYKHKKYIFIVLLFLVFTGLFFYKNKKTKISKNNSEKKVTTSRIPASVNKPNNKNLPDVDFNHNESENSQGNEPLPRGELETITPHETEIRDYHQADEDLQEQVNSIDTQNLEPETFEQIEANNEQPVIQNTEQIQLLSAPTSLSKEFYEFNYSSLKFPAKLRWSETSGAKYYEIEVTNLERNHKRYFKRSKNQFNVMLFPNENYEWRVMAYNNDSRPLTYYSKRYSIKVVAPTDDERSLASESVSDEPINYSETESDDVSYFEDDSTSENISTNTAKDKERKEEAKKSLWSKFWGWAGAGMSTATYSQDTTGSTELSHTSVRTPHVTGEAGIMITQRFGLTGSFGLSPGRLIEESSLFDTPYTWTSYSLEGLYLLSDDWSKSFNSSWYVRFGANFHSIPVLAILPTAGVLELTDNDQINVGVGVGRKTSHSKKFSSNIYLNAQIPMSASTTEYDYELDSGFIFSGFFGLNYQLNNHFNLGLYWQGKFLFSNYYLSDEIDSINGTQFLINNNLGFYLGLEY